MPVERRGQVTHVKMESTGNRRNSLSWRKAAVFVGWHEPDESRGSSQTTGLPTCSHRTQCRITNRFSARGVPWKSHHAAFPHPRLSNWTGAVNASSSRRKSHVVAHGKLAVRAVRRTKPNFCISSDDATQFLKPAKPCGCTVSVGSEEARLRAGLRPPLKLYVPISGIQLSRRRSWSIVRTKRRY